MAGRPRDCRFSAPADSALRRTSERKRSATPLSFKRGSKVGCASPLARLSLLGLRYVASLGLDDQRTIAARLYRFNTVPTTPAVRRRWLDAHAVAEFLQLDRLDCDRRLLTKPSGPWHGWRVRGVARAARREARYKLYVSPRTEYTGIALREVIEGLSDAGALECKVGRTLPGLLRPDKLVVYFRTFSDLKAAATRWAGALAGMPAQGVPFTADAGGDGLLSWGLDPPAVRSARGRPVSWREWVTYRLAEGIVAARRTPEAAGAPIRLVLSRLARAGVNPRTWAPSSRLRRTLAFG